MAEDKARDAQFQRLMNKVALVTLWIEPNAHQIVKYTFDNVGFDFLPAQWLVRIDDFKPTMRMGQPFPGVWLPDDLDIDFVGGTAFGAKLKEIVTTPFASPPDGLWRSRWTKPCTGIG